MANKKEKQLGEPVSATTAAANAPAMLSVPQAKPQKGARTVFNLFNFLGLHWVGNSTLSLWITYNLVPTRPAQVLIEGLSKAAKPFAAGWETIKSPFAKVYYGIRHTLGFKNGFTPLTELEKAENIAHNSRSAVETLCMCVAGCIVLFPVKWLEDHKQQTLNFVDRWILHPFNKQRHEENRERLRAPEKHGEHKETWANLLRARFVALVPIFLLDNQVQKFNNRRYKSGKSSIDKVLWKAGADIYDAKNETMLGSAANNILDKVLPKNWREKVIAFFANKDVTVAKVQDMVRPMILDTVGSPPELHDLHKQIHALQEQIKHHPNDKALHASLGEEIRTLNKEFLATNPHLQKDVERVIFAEQTRLFAKEWYLTLIYTGLLFFIGKTKTAARALEFLHLKKKEPVHADDPKPATVATPDNTTDVTKETTTTTATSPSEAPQKRWSEREENQPRKPVATASASFQDSVSQSSKEATVSI